MHDVERGPTSRYRGRNGDGYDYDDDCDREGKLQRGLTKLSAW